MTLRRPLWMQAAGGDPTFEYSANEDRLAIAATIRSPGVVTGMAVSQRGAGANMSVDVATGIVAITGQDISDQGRYLCQSTAVENLAIPAPPASGSRTHRVVARVKDKLHSGSYSTYEWLLEVLEDTGTGTPALPNSAIDLAYVAVTSATVSITSSNITDKRSYAQGLPGRPLQVSSDAGRPAVPYTSELIWRTDKGYAELWDGSAWIPRVQSPPYAQLTMTANQSVPNNALTAVAWDSEVSDSHGGHSTSSNNSRYTAQLAGLYQVTATVPWALNGTGLRELALRVNATTTYAGSRITAGSGITLSLSATRLIRLGVGDYVEAIAFQNSGGALDINQAYGTGPGFDIVWVRS